MVFQKGISRKEHTHMDEHEWRARVESRIVTLETHRAVDAVHRGNVETRLSGIEDTLKWLVRLIFGALIAAAVGFALNGGLVL